MIHKIYSPDVLDSKYEELLNNKLALLQSKLSENELCLISYNDLSLMGRFLISLKPKSHTRRFKKIVLKYADIYIEIGKNGLNDKSFVHNNAKSHLLEVSKYLEKFGFKNKGIWYPIILVFLAIEISIILLFFKSTIYILPVVSFLLFLKVIISEKKAHSNGKLLCLYWVSINCKLGYGRKNNMK